MRGPHERSSLSTPKKVGGGALAGAPPQLTFNPAKRKKFGLMIGMNAPQGAMPGTPWTWIRPIVILALGVVAFVLCAAEGAVLAVTAGGGLMGTMHAILPRSADPARSDEGRFLG